MSPTRTVLQSIKYKKNWVIVIVPLPVNKIWEVGLSIVYNIWDVVQRLLRGTVLASDLSTHLLDGYKVKMMGKKCPNYTMKEEMHGHYAKIGKKHRQLSNPS